MGKNCIFPGDATSHYHFQVLHKASAALTQVLLELLLFLGFLPYLDAKC